VTDSAHTEFSAAVSRGKDKANAVVEEATLSGTLSSVQPSYLWKGLYTEFSECVTQGKELINTFSSSVTARRAGQFSSQVPANSRRSDSRNTVIGRFYKKPAKNRKTPIGE
jgi:hypothetical protein